MTRLSALGGLWWFRRAALALALGASLLIHIFVARIPDTMGDALLFGVWGERAAQVGLDGAYFDRPSYINYPPVYPAMLEVLGKLRPFLPITMTDGTLENLHFFVKLPSLLAAVCTSLVLFLVARRRVSHWTAFAVMASFAFNPAVIFNSAYWGQIESIYSLFVILALSFLYSHNGLAWVFVTLAVLTKAQAAPFAPIVLLVTAREFGRRAVLRGAAASFLTIGVVLSPFIVRGHAALILLRLLNDLGTSPFASQNAHNLWWIVSSGRWIASPAYRAIGFALFGAFYAFMLVRTWRDRPRESIHLACAVAAATFFLLMTGMHENHLFAVLPLLAVATCGNGKIAVLYAAFTTTFLVNMVVHDPFLEAEFIYGRAFDPVKIWVFDPSGPKSALQWALAFSNSVAVTLLVAALVLVWLRVTAAERKRTGLTGLMAA